MKHGATILSVGGLLASFTQMVGCVQTAGGIMFVANLVVAFLALSIDWDRRWRHARTRFFRKGA